MKALKRIKVDRRHNSSRLQKKLGLICVELQRKVRDAD
ncbi:hypothetical protein COLO4_16320 [Corchorus olitorius]|uniref:Uncharacterized protein n=1 Tax=Corchorus olitorius TaxID=93759 RepID=A0A1R3JI10_9ROSI|nr:hypothetical protein COLO4_16320 [Corchorus olitorius]